MERMLDLMLIAAVCVFIVDVSGWTQAWKDALARWSGARNTGGRMRPFDCSLCCTWWAGLAWCLCRGEFSLLAVAECALAAASTPVILAAWNLCRTIAQGLLDWLTLRVDNLLH